MVMLYNNSDTKKQNEYLLFCFALVLSIVKLRYDQS